MKCIEVLCNIDTCNCIPWIYNELCCLHNYINGHNHGVRKVTQINVSNQELIQKSKDIHGELYHKINSLQRDLNISLENNKRLQDKIDELRKTSFTPAEHSEIIKSFKQAINILEQ